MPEPWQKVCGWPRQPRFSAILTAAGPRGDYYLSQIASGQMSASPCADAGSDTAANMGRNGLTTWTYGVTDSGAVDAGYRYLP